MAGQAQSLAQPLIDYWATFVILANALPAPSATTAREHLQAAADQVSDANADAFFLEVSQIYQDLGITAQNTYISLRNEINLVGEAASELVFATIVEAVRKGTAAAIVANDLIRADQQAELDGIPTDIATIAADRDLQSDQVLIDAYNAGITELNKRADVLRGKPGVV